MEVDRDDYKSPEVTYKFYIPENNNDLFIFQNAIKFFLGLIDIHERCRSVWKYKDNATEEEIKFAELISEIVCQTGALDAE